MQQSVFTHREQFGYNDKTLVALMANMKIKLT